MSFKPWKCDMCLLRRTRTEQHEMRWSLCLLRSEIWAKPGKRKTLTFSGIFSCNEKCSVAHWKHCYSLSSESDKWTPVKRQLSQKHLMSFLVRESQIFSSPACLCKAQCILYFMLSVLFLQFCVSEMCLRERLDSGCSVQYSSSAVFMGWRCSLNNVHGLIIL